MKAENILKKRREYFRGIAEAMGIYLAFWNEKDVPINGMLTMYHYDKEHTIYNGYFGSVKPIYKTDSSINPFAYEYNGQQYKVLADAIKVIEEDNKTKEFPTYTDEITWFPCYRVEAKIRWYMKSVLKFEDDMWDSCLGHSYCQKDLFGNKIHKIAIGFNENAEDIKDDNEVSGYILHSLSYGSWIQSDFKGIKEFVEKINGFIEPSMLFENATNMETLGNMDENKKDYHTDNFVLDKALNSNKVNCLNATKHQLELALEKINKQLENK